MNVIVQQARKANVVRYARAGDFVLVTNRPSDFRQL
jgi:hypothetical protein